MTGAAALLFRESGGGIRELATELVFRRRAEHSNEHVCPDGHDTEPIRAGQPCPTCKAVI